MTSEIAKLISDFIATLEAYVVERVNTRLRDVLAIGLITQPTRAPSSLLEAPEHFNCRSVVADLPEMELPDYPEKPRRKAPVQLCPAPRCKGRAAPVFGMLCAKHKGTDKATVAVWRELRRARKARR